MAREWTKTYKVTHDKGNFQIYVSKHGSNDFIAAISYYTTQGIWTANDLEITSKAEHFVGNGEKAVYDTAIAWMEENLPGNYKIELS